MGGGGGGGPSSLGNIKSLLDKAKEELHKSEEEGRCNAFLSFAFEDLNEVNLLRGQAKNEKSEIEFNDWSVKEPFDSKRADYIKQRIGERIGQCSVTVVYVSDVTATSKWVAWEIEESLKRGKKVIAVYSGKKAPTNLPAAIRENNIKSVPWTKLSKEL